MATNSVKARSSFEQLKDDDTKWKNSVQINNNQNRRKEELSSDLETLFGEEAGIYETLQVEKGDSIGVRDRMENHEKFMALKEKKRSEEQTWEDRKRTAKEDSLYEKWASKLEELTDEEIRGKIEAFQEKSERHESIIKQISAIETQTDSARAGTSMEKAMEERSDALDELSRTYNQNLESITGDLLVGALREDSFEENRSEVYTRADKILNKITAGRFTLLINEGEKTGFRAYDKDLSMGQDLEELSTGTRIQLLFAVRLAYIEQMEKGTALPILADELLANCDDERAGIIIETLSEISKSRQVFYFTAQGDEVSKWKEHLAKDSGASFGLHILSGSDSDNEEFPEELSKDQDQPA